MLLPLDPDGSARALRARLGCAVIVSDSFGRAWRHGQCDVAIGIAGLAPLQDWRGLSDRRGRELHATWIAVADQAAAAADLARGGKDAGHPAVVITGLERHVSADDGPGAAALVDELKNKPGVDIAAPFGLSLHVGGRDPARLEAAIAPYRSRADLTWAQSTPSLEDVFIKLMGDARGRA